MSIPDVRGLPPAEARRRLTAAGVAEITQTVTAPPRRPVAGELRVVRQRETQRGTELVVAAFPRLDP